MMMFPRSARLKAAVGAAFIAGALSLSPVANAQTVSVPVYDLLASQARFATTVTLINVTGMVERARGPYPFTMFAPTEAAWADRSGVKGQLLNYLNSANSNRANDVFPDVSKMIHVIRSWTFAGAHPLSEFEGKQVTLKNLNGDNVMVDGTSSPLTVTFTSTVTNQSLKADLTVPPLVATNGLVYPCDNVSVE